MNEHERSSSQQSKKKQGERLMNPEIRSSTSQLQYNDNSLLEGSTPQQTTKKRQGSFRGPSRALKYKKLRIMQPGKVKAIIPPTLGSVVGERANQFIAECADWIKEICPLNVKKWKDMPQNALDQLNKRIQAKYEFGEGAHVQNAIKTQCSTLYRHWRERLKADYFSNCKSLVEAEHNCPPTINTNQWKWLVYNHWSSPKERERSEKNRANAYAKKIKSACGAKSIARTIYELVSFCSPIF